MASNAGIHVLRATALATTLLLLDGCAAGSIFGPRPATEATAPGSGAETSGLTVYLETMQRLIEGDSLTQAETFNEIADAAEFAPTTMNRLLYALALAVPGHAGFDPAAAASRLQALIAAGPTLEPEERMLAEIQLEMTNRLVILESARDQIEQEAEGAQQSRDAEYDAQLRQLRAENETLKAELDEARSMLDAITSIERSLSEREQTHE